MNHFFDVSEASKVGVEKSIILANFRFWLEKNKANEKNLNGGYYWTYNSSKALSLIFPYWSAQKIARLIRELESDGLLVSDNFNRVGYDRTKWYSMPEYSIVHIQALHCSDLNNGMSNIEQPIPDSKTDSKPDHKEMAFFEKIVDMYIDIIKATCNAKGLFKDAFLNSKERMKPLMARVSENAEHETEQFWFHYLTECSKISWVRDGIDGEAVCTFDMLINKTKFNKNVEAFWA